MRSVTPAVENASSVVEWLHDRIGLTYEEVAAALGTTDRTVQRWRAGAVEPRRANRDALGEADELRFWLDSVFRDSTGADAREWLHKRLLDLKGKTPLECVRAGRFDVVIEILATLHTGAFI